MSKFKTIFTLIAMATCSGVTAYYIGKFTAKDKIKIVEKVVEVQTDTSQQDRELAELQSAMSASSVLLTAKQKQIIKMLSTYGITGNDSEIKAIIDAAHWMAVAMYQECGICSNIEAQMIGYSLILHLREKKHGSTMERVVKWRESNGVYFLSFVPTGRLSIANEDDYLRYFGYALSLISQSKDTEIAQQKYQELYSANGYSVKAMYWCNEKSSSCSWHNTETKRGCFYKTKIDLRDKISASIQDSDISKHTAYLNTGACNK